MRMSSRASRNTRRGHDVPTFEGAPIRGQGQRHIATADVEDDRHPGEPLAVGTHELGKIRQQLARAGCP